MKEAREMMIMFPSFLSGTKNNTHAVIGYVVVWSMIPPLFSGIKKDTRAVKDSIDIRNVVHFASTLVMALKKHPQNTLLFCGYSIT